MSYLKALVEGLVGSVPAVEFAVAHVGNEISSMHLKDTSYHIAHIVNHYKMFLTNLIKFISASLTLIPWRTHWSWFSQSQ